MVSTVTSPSTESPQVDPVGVQVAASLDAESAVASPDATEIVVDEQPKRRPRKRPDPVEQSKRIEQVKSRPVFKQKLTVKTIEAQRVMNRSFDRAAYALFSIDVIMRIIGEQTDKRSEIDELETTIQDHITKVSDDMDKEIARFEKLMADNGIENEPEYTNPVEYSIEITSPQVARFASLTRKLDRFMVLSDSLWMNAVLSNFQRTDGHYHWQQRVIKLAGRIIGIERFARIAARRSGRDAEISEAAPETMLEVDEEVAKASKEKITSEV